jgi:hypothetical protein
MLLPLNMIFCTEISVLAAIMVMVSSELTGIWNKVGNAFLNASVCTYTFNQKEGGFGWILLKCH